MLRKLRGKIESKRNSSVPLWKIIVFLKDFVRFYKDRINIRHVLYSLSYKKLVLPDFLIIGAQKSATTWLNAILRYHPGLCLPKKEIHFFDENFNKGLNWYSYYFRKGVGKVKGETTPAYSVLPVERIEFVKRIMPDIRLIYLLRNPIDRAWSHAVMDLVKNPNKRFKDIPESEFYAHFKSQASRSRGNYLTCIENWLSGFPKEQLYIGFFDDIANMPEKIIKEILEHLGVDANLDWNKAPIRQKVNSNPEIEIPDKYYRLLYEVYKDQIQLLYERLEKPVIKKWLSFPSENSSADK